MPDFDDIFNSHKQKIADESQKLNGGPSQPEIQRDYFRRPWSGEVDFEKTPPLQTPNSSEVLYTIPWYGTALGLKTYLQKRKNTAFALLAFFGILFGSVGFYYPTTYFSTVHLFTPPTIESLSSRLNTVMEKVEFATIPIDPKMPVMLISKEMGSTTARNWVLSKLPKGISPNSVNVEAGYVLTSQILIIHGFADSPEGAATVTELYQKYFEYKVNSIRSEQVEKIKKWTDLQLENVASSIRTISPDLQTAAADFSNNESNQGIRQKLNDQLSDLISKKLSLQKRIQDLAQIQSGQNIESASIDEKGFQDTLELYQNVSQKLQVPNLSSEMRALYSQEKEKLIEQLQVNARNALPTTNRAASDLQLQISQLQNVIKAYANKSGSLKAAPTNRDSLSLKIANLENQQSGLLNLKTQISLDHSVPSGQYKVIQEATIDPGTESPLSSVKYGLALLSVLMATGICLLLLQLMAPIDMTGFHRKP